LNLYFDYACGVVVLMITICPLGTNGYAPTFGRQTMCHVVQIEDTLIILDAGTGLARLFEIGLERRVSAYSGVHIVLSHYHLDHTVGLCYLPALFGNGVKVTLWCPGNPFVAFDPIEALKRLLSPPLFAEAIDDLRLSLEVKCVNTERFSIGGTDIRIRAQKHPGGSIGVRLGDSIAYLTDTPTDMSAINFVSGVNVLLHEVWLSGEERRASHPELAKHADAPSVRLFALASRIGMLLPIHNHPSKSNEALMKLWDELEDESYVVHRPIEGEVIVIS
jgi:ribonuclease BN (tRNA processing enzyme)